MVRRPLCLACLLLIACICLAGWLGIPLAKGNPLPASVREWAAQHPNAVVCGEAVRCARTDFSQSIYLKNAFLADRPNKIPIENIRIFLKQNTKVPVGALITVSGKLEPIEAQRNPGEFDSRQYYAADRIFYFMKDCEIIKQSKTYSIFGQALEDIREKIINIFEKTAGTDAAVFEAMLLGEKNNLEDVTKIRYQMAGIIHILAISGLHISFLGMGLYNVMVKAGFGLFVPGILSLAAMLQYGMMAGGSVSTMRAVGMFLAWAGAKMLGRCYDMLTALALAAVLLLLDSPAYLYNSSFLLSFAAVLGIGAVFPVLDKIFEVKSKIAKTFLASLSVQFATLPVVMFFYGEVSVVGIFLNLFILPTVGIVLASGACGALAGFFSFQAAWAILLPGRAFLYLYGLACNWAAKFPCCTWVAGKPFIWQAVIFYALLAAAFAGAFLLAGKEVFQEGKKRFLPKILCICAASLGIGLIAYRPLEGMRITCLDVGQGDGAVVEWEGGCFLIDGGSSNKMNLGQYQLLPYLKARGVQYVDMVFVSHTDEDHISGVRQILEFIRDGLTAIRVGGMVLPKWEHKTGAYKDLEQIANEAGVDIFYAQKGDILNVGDLYISFLGPVDGKGTDSNENGLVMELCYGKFYALFTGDIGMETEEKILPLLEHVDLLKTAHHGSGNSTGKEFLEKTSPDIAVISCSDSNRYGHPSPDTVNRLEQAGCQVEYTMKNGAVTVRTDGQKIWVSRFVEE